MLYRAPAILSVCGGLLVAQTSTAFAQDSGAERRARAEELFEQASALVAKRDFANACRKFEEVVKLQPQGIGAHMSLADCYVGEGRLASAHATLGRAAELAGSASQPERVQLARDRQESLTPRLSNMQIVVSQELLRLQGLQVLRNGVPMTETQLNVATPVDRGAYGIIVTAPGRKRFEKTFTVTDEGTMLTATVSLPPAEAQTETPRWAQTAPSEHSTSPWSGLRIAGIVTGVGGLGLLATGIGLGVDGISQMEIAATAYSEGERNGDEIQTASALKAHAAGERQATAGWVILGVGAATAGAGLIMAIVAPEVESNAPSKVSLSPWLSETQWGVRVDAQW